MKKVLVITYSQSGQLDEIVDNILKPLRDEVEISYEKLKPIPDYPFPWTDMTFWDAMPESVRMIPSGLEPLNIDRSKTYDLIVLGYPVWFLSPPIPITSFLKSETGKEILNGKPVVTVIGSRNMWVGAQEDIKKMILEAGGLLKGNIVLRDKHHNLPSVITIIYWMMTGRKDRLWGIFPKPGVSDEDIEESERFGLPVLQALNTNSFDNLQADLLAAHAIEIIPSVVSIEKKGKRIFKIWSGLILKKGSARSKARIDRLKLFKWYLLFVIFAVSPIATIVFYLTYPFFFFKINRDMSYYKGITLKD
jgi:hypothetical protein